MAANGSAIPRRHRSSIVLTEIFLSLLASRKVNQLLFHLAWKNEGNKVHCSNHAGVVAIRGVEQDKKCVFVCQGSACGIKPSIPIRG